MSVGDPEGFASAIGTYIKFEYRQSEATLVVVNLCGITATAIGNASRIYKTTSHSRPISGSRTDVKPCGDVGDVRYVKQWAVLKVERPRFGNGTPCFDQPMMFGRPSLHSIASTTTKHISNGVACLRMNKTYAVHLIGAQ